MIERNFIKIYEDSFKSNWELTALTEYVGGKSVTYGDLATRIAQTHLFFGNIGLKHGDKVALCGKDSIGWVTTFMSAVTYGAVIVPILSEFNPTDVTHIVNHSEAEIFFVSDSIWEYIDFDKLLRVKCVVSVDTGKVLAQSEGAEFDRAKKLLKRRFNKKYPKGYGPDDIHYPELGNDRLVEINYTSGTTGFSKGVMLTANNLAGNTVFGIDSHLHYRESRVLSFLPLAHAYGCAFDMLTPLGAGSHITLLGKIPSPKILLKAFNDVKPHLILCVPLILEKIYKNQIMPMISKGFLRWTLALPLLDSLVYSKIRKRLIGVFGGEFSQVIVGGAPLNPDVEQFLQKIKFPFTVGYGMTECGPLISYTYWKDFLAGSSGRTLPHIMESKILSDDPQHVPGEICVRGENVMKGYFKNPEATAAVLDADGWLHTGDMGTVNADGTLFLRGRNKTMILSASGQNIYPEEIEAKLNNMLYVAESLVVERDGKLVALVYPDYGAMDEAEAGTANYDALMERVLQELNKLVAPYERISRIILIPNEFEKTPKRSIKRFLYTQK